MAGPTHRDPKVMASVRCAAFEANPKKNKTPHKKYQSFFFDVFQLPGNGSLGIVGSVVELISEPESITDLPTQSDRHLARGTVVGDHSVAFIFTMLGLELQTLRRGSATGIMGAK
jgi:hypothetical protein